jgi:choline-sulfatase
MKKRGSAGVSARGKPRVPSPPQVGTETRRYWAAGLVLLALAGVGAWWLSRPAPPRGDARPDVLLVTIDTLRADHVGCYGDRGAATPVMDALAARGARFAEAVVQVPLTLPSHASILTGVTPLVHGVRDNAGFVLGSSPRTLAEAFQNAGYRTAAFVSGFPVHRRFGLSRGFAVYDDRFPRGSDPSRPPYVERRADLTVAAAAAWLRAQASGGSAGPAFAWVHLFDPHAPYEAPQPEGSTFRDRPYDGEVAFSDRQLGVLLEQWRAARHRRDPLVLVTSDHGEGLGEHAEPTHGLFIYDSTLRVPLIVAGPGVPRGTLVTGAVSSIDIAPTLADLAGVPPIAGAEGRSLKAALSTGRAPGEAVYAESLFGRLGFGWAPLHGWRERGLMFIDAPRPEVYDLRADPAQAKNVAEERADDVARMRRAVRAAVARAPDARPGTVPRETTDRLRSLGYVASGSAARPSLRDPKDSAGLAARIEGAMALERADPSRATAEFRAALREDPDNVVARRHLAMALAAARDYDAAVGELKALLALGDDSLETLTLLGDCHRLSGRAAEALDAFGRAVAQHGGAPEGYNGQGKTLTALGRTDDARQAFERALSAAPDDPDALEGLADLALARGDTADAALRLAALSARDPGDSRVALKRGVVLVRGGDLEQAIALFRSVAEGEPSNAEAALDLGGALAKAGRAAEAVGWFERAIAAGARSPVAWNGLAMARLETGNQAGAADALRESLRAKPDQPNIRELLRRIQ